MNYLAHKKMTATQRTHRVRTVVSGTSERPRLAIDISNSNVRAQIIDDSTGKTLVSAGTDGKDIKGNMSDKAKWVGEEIAKSAKKAKLGKVSFDRRAKKYHGRIKVLAEAARAGGLEF